MNYNENLLSIRLRTISSFCDENLNIADIGADHGFVLISQFAKNANRLLLGVENKKGPYDTLVTNLKLYGCNDKIRTSLSDGLSEVTDNYKEIVLAGMGTKTIMKIVNDHLEKLKNIDYFIVDSHTNTYSIRKFFVKLGYSIEKETFLKENKKVYQIIKFKKGEAHYSETELKYGPILIKERSKEFLDYCRNLICYLSELRDSHAPDSLYIPLSDEILELINILNENK